MDPPLPTHEVPTATLPANWAPHVSSFPPSLSQSNLIDFSLAAWSLGEEPQGGLGGVLKPSGVVNCEGEAQFKWQHNHIHV